LASVMAGLKPGHPVASGEIMGVVDATFLITDKTMLRHFPGHPRPLEGSTNAALPECAPPAHGMAESSGI
jgi:hypothetical protein